MSFYKVIYRDKIKLVNLDSVHQICVSGNRRFDFWKCNFVTGSNWNEKLQTHFTTFYKYKIDQKYHAYTFFENEAEGIANRNRNLKHVANTICRGCVTFHANRLFKPYQTYKNICVNFPPFSETA